MRTKRLLVLLFCLPSMVAMAASPNTPEKVPEVPRNTLDVRTLAKAQRAYDEGVLRAKLSSALASVKSDSNYAATVKAEAAPVSSKFSEPKEYKREPARLVSVFGTSDALVAEARLPSGHVKSLRINDVLDDYVVTDINAHGVVVRKKNTESRFLAVGSRF
ncbi:MAG: hypothetical protein LW629_00265 [Burkholderiales bacterium]|jgi:type IV pilus biogenesis protein PilP|nr:hypothetical protein [Burkholderiales bacterium]